MSWTLIADYLYRDYNAEVTNTKKSRLSTKEKKKMPVFSINEIQGDTWALISWKANLSRAPTLRQSETGTESEGGNRVGETPSSYFFA